MIVFRIAGLFLWLSAVCGVGVHGAAPLPNLVFVLADDLGTGDIAALAPASKVPTPNLDRLVREGRHFNNAYCPVSVCSPSRYALMTGRYPWRSYKKTGVLGNWEPPLVADGILTLPAMLRSAGYATAGFGKWHLGATYKTLDGNPPVGAGAFSAPYTGINIDLAQPITGGPLDRGFERWHGFITASEQIIFEGNRAVATLGSENYPPLKIPGFEKLSRIQLADYSGDITDRTVAFLRERVGQREPFFCYYAPYVPHLPLAVRAEFSGKTRAGDYGDYVHQLDSDIGRLLAALDETGAAKNTLVLFASDNGSHWRATGEGHRPNGALRGTKHQVWEGGTRTPFILRWPGRVPAGSASAQLLALNDVLATLATLVGYKLPPGVGADSLDLLQLWLGEREEPIRASVITRESGPRYAIREGAWKYIAPGKQGAPAELYDLAADPGEETNLAGNEPARASTLAEKLAAELQGARTAL
jgi:arylsulfatase A-like enzyme